MTDKPTVRAVVAYAEQLRAQADRKIAADPWADPYRPSEAAARKLAQRRTNERIRNLVADHRAGAITDATLEDQLAEAPHVGAQAALDELAARAADQEAAERAQRERSERSLKRLQRHRAQDYRDQAARQRGFSPGQRLDHALAQLAVVSDLPASRLDGDRVHGGDTRPIPVDKDGNAHVDSTFSTARRKVLDLADDLERLVENAERRDIGTAA